MDTSEVYDDEVVADSEEEGGNDLEFQLNESFTHNARMTLQDDLTTTRSETAIRRTMSILPQSPVSGGGNAKPTPLPDPTTRPRPKPRPRYKKTTTDTAGNSSNVVPPMFTPDILMDIPMGTSSIADRAKMRSRKSKPDAVMNMDVLNDIIELTSDDDDLAILRVPKPSRKTKTKPSKVEAPSLSDNDFIPDSRPKLKIRINKRSKTRHPTPDRHLSQDTIPVPTSSIHDALPAPLEPLISQLPPSDPPTSTAAIHDYPPIVTLPNLDTDLDLPPSSPSSLFSIPDSGGKKRKRAIQYIDELESDGNQVTSAGMDADFQMTPVPALLPPPPSTFFAGSSSQHTVEPTDIHLTMMPPTVNLTSNAIKTVKKPPKPRKPRKKKERDGIEEDHLDPAEPSSDIKKKAPRKKVEVFIERSVKCKGKEKAKEVFKSKEFIDDEDEDDGVVEPSALAAGRASKPDSITSLSSVPDSEDEYGKEEDPRKKRKPIPDVVHKQSVRTKDKAGVADRDELDVLGADDSTSLSSIPGSDAEYETPRKGVESVVHGKGKQSAKTKQKHNDESSRLTKTGKSKKVIVSDEEEEAPVLDKRKGKRTARKNHSPTPEADITSGNYAEEDLNEETRGHEEMVAIKENITPSNHPKTATTPAPSLFPSLASRYTIAPKTKSTPLSELIRRVNSLPGSPFASPRPHGPATSNLKPSTPKTTYSPYLKSSRSFLSRIAPLHPNRRTPPPPLPPPPPPKKTKKEREREEQWEEELIESVGGITEWSCMTDAERKELRKVKWEREMSGWEE